MCCGVRQQHCPEVGATRTWTPRGPLWGYVTPQLHPESLWDPKEKPDFKCLPVLEGGLQ